MNTEPAPRELLRTAREAALRAGEIQRRSFRTLDPSEVRLKGRRNPVTDADLRSEAVILEHLQRHHPGHTIVAEESGGVAGDGPYEWFVDPLDGTVNFSHGLPLFSVAIAVRRGSEWLASVIYAPVLHELYEASVGEGTTLNGRAVQVSRTTDLSEAFLGTGFCYRRNEVVDNNVAQFADLVLHCQDLRRLGSAALDLALVASGRYDGYWEPHLSSWDIAAGILLVREAGGTVTDMHGGDAILEQGKVVATNGHFHEALLERLSRSGPAKDAGTATNRGA